MTIARILPYTTAHNFYQPAVGSNWPQARSAAPQAKPHPTRLGVPGSQGGPGGGPRGSHRTPGTPYKVINPESDRSFPVPRRAAGFARAWGRLNLILRFVKSSRSPRVTHSFHYAGAPNKYLYCGALYKSPKITENRAACGGRGSLPARAADKYRQKSLNCTGVSRAQNRPHD